MIQPETLLKTDGTTLVIEARKDGKFVVKSKAWEENKVIMPDQAVELRWQDGQVHVIRKARVSEPAAPDAGEDDFAADEDLLTTFG